jgi:P-type Ca2+ transporter type 2C
VGTLFLEAYFEPSSVALATTMGFVVFSLFNVVIGLSCRSETNSAFNRDILSDRRQLMLYGLALLLTFLPTELGVLQRSFGTAGLTLEQWLLCIGLAIALLLVDEVIKFFLRRRRGGAPAETTPSLVPATTA